MNTKPLDSIEIGFSRITYRKLWWNFLYVKNDKGKMDMEDHPFYKLSPHRVVGNIWWVPNLKIVLDKRAKEYSGTFDRITMT